MYSRKASHLLSDGVIYCHYLPSKSLRKFNNLSLQGLFSSTEHHGILSPSWSFYACPSSTSSKPKTGVFRHPCVQKRRLCHCWAILVSRLQMLSALLLPALYTLISSQLLRSPVFSLRCFYRTHSEEQMKNLTPPCCKAAGRLLGRKTLTS